MNKNNIKSVYKLSYEEKLCLKEEQAQMKQISRNIKKWQKVLSKLDDEDRQTLIDKLVKYGYVFDMSNQEKLAIGFQNFVEIEKLANKKVKKLSAGMKAVEQNVPAKRGRKPKKQVVLPEKKDEPLKHVEKQLGSPVEDIQNADDNEDDSLLNDARDDDFSPFYDDGLSEEQVEWRRQYFSDMEEDE